MDGKESGEADGTKRKDASSAGRMQIKLPVEDKALQAILAARRRSLEMSKLPEEEGEKEGVPQGVPKIPKEQSKMTECEEIQAAKNPMKWLSTINNMYERSKRTGSVWNRMREPPPMFEPVREITYREFSLQEEEEYISQVKEQPIRQQSKKVNGDKTKKLSYKTKMRAHRKHQPQLPVEPESSSDEDTELSASEDIGGDFGQSDGGNLRRRVKVTGKSEEDTVKNRIKSTKLSMHLSRELKYKRRMLGVGGIKEMYTDKVRAAAVTLGDQDIKTSLKVKQKNERRVVVPEDMDANVYLTEAQKNLTIGNLKAALVCAQKAVEAGGPDPQTLLMRSRCLLLSGKLNEALEDAQNALTGDPSLTKALLVQAEALYTMGEFERALVLFHRGNRRRPDLSAFQRGIQKAREAILNAIGGANFPEVKSPATRRNSVWSSETPSTAPKGSLTQDRGKENDRWKKGEGKSGGFDSIKAPSTSNQSLQKSKRTASVEKTSPLFTEIKTSKLASKRLLGGLSSDKEFLHKLISRGDLNDGPKFSINVESSRAARRRSSAVPVRKEEITPGADIINVAREALTSIQYLEAFLWQRDPGGLSANSVRRPVTHRPKDTKKGFKSMYSEKVYSNKGSAKKNKRHTVNFRSMKLEEIEEKVLDLINKLKHSDGKSLKLSLTEAESYVEELRQFTVKSENCASQLCRLLTSIGKVLPLEGRGEDGIAVLRDATEIAKRNDLQEEYRQASDTLGHVLAAEGYRDEAVSIWESLFETRQSASQSTESHDTVQEEGTAAVNFEEVDNNNVDENEVDQTARKTSICSAFDIPDEVDSGINSRS